jgi:PhnB protein
MFLYTSDVDTVFSRAVAAGAQVSMPVTDMFWGDRYGTSPPTITRGLCCA